MSEPRFDEMNAGEHEMKHAMKRMEHDLKQAGRVRAHAIKHAIKCDAMGFGEEVYSARPGPRSVDEALVEIDSYLSYLEDLPKEKLAPYADKVDGLAVHLDKVRRSLK